MLLISFLKYTITYHFLIRTYFYVRTFTNNVSGWSQPESPGWYIDSWRCIVPIRVESHFLLPSLLVHWFYQDRNDHAILYQYGDVRQYIMYGEPGLQWLHLQVEQHFWGFIRRFQVKHILLFQGLEYIVE